MDCKAKKLEYLEVSECNVYLLYEALEGLIFALEKINNKEATKREVEHAKEALRIVKKPIAR